MLPIHTSVNGRFFLCNILFREILALAGCLWGRSCRGRSCGRCSRWSAETTLAEFWLRLQRCNLLVLAGLNRHIQVFGGVFGRGLGYVGKESILTILRGSFAPRNSLSFAPFTALALSLQQQLMRHVWEKDRGWRHLFLTRWRIAISSVSGLLDLVRA